MAEKFHPERFDVIVTSPPYNISMGYNSYKDNLPYSKYLDWLNDVFTETKRVLKDDGSFFLNVGSTCKEPTRAMDVCKIALDHFKLQNDIIWVKSISIDQTSYGHFKPINSERYLNQTHESIYHFTKAGDLPIDRLGIGVPYQHKSNIDRWKHTGKKDLRCRGNVWFIPYKTVTSKKVHPAGFPPLLPEFCIKLHGFRSDLRVLDPFLGAGSTLVACKKLGIVNGSGIELDPFYCKVAEENLDASIGIDTDCLADGNTEFDSQSGMADEAST